MADWSGAACDEYSYPATERVHIIDAWNEDTAEAIWEADEGNQPNIDWCNQESPNEPPDVLWPESPRKPQYVNMSQSPTRQSPRRKSVAEGQRESLQEEQGADVPSASVSARKGSRYGRRLANLTLTETTTLPSVSSTRSTSPERPKSPVKVLPDLAQAHPPTIQVHINDLVKLSRKSGVRNKLSLAAWR